MAHTVVQMFLAPGSKLLPLGAVRFLWVFALVLASMPGCGSAPVPSPRSAAEPRHPSVAGPDPAEGPFATVALGQTGLHASLPSATHWDVKEHGRSARVTAADLGLVLEVRRDRATRQVTANQCEQQLRDLWPSLPRRSPSDAVAARPWRVAKDTEGLLWGTVDEKHNGDPTLRATVVAIAAGIGECLSVIATLQTQNDQQGEELANRLVLVADRILPSIQLREPEDRVERSARPL